MLTLTLRVFLASFLSLTVAQDSLADCDFERGWSRCNWLAGPLRSDSWQISDLYRYWRPTAGWRLYNVSSGEEASPPEGYMSYVYAYVSGADCTARECTSKLSGPTVKLPAEKSCLDIQYWVDAEQPFRISVFKSDHIKPDVEIWATNTGSPRREWRHGRISVSNTSIFTSLSIEVALSRPLETNGHIISQRIAVDNIRMYAGECVELMEEDILLMEGGENDPPNHEPFNAAVINANNLWDNAKIPYTMDEAFSSSEKATILRSMNEINTKTCVKFVLRTNEKNYLRVFKGSWCYSFAGKISKEDAQPVAFHSTCLNFGTVLHELMHAVGFYHEHSRSDRDDWITILWNNVASGSTTQFQKYTLAEVDHLNLPYDYDSVMHYSKTAYARLPGLITIEPKQSGHVIGQRSRLSALDIKKVNTKYRCTGQNAAKTETIVPLLVPIRRTLDCQFEDTLCDWKAGSSSYYVPWRVRRFNFVLNTAAHYEQPYGRQFRPSGNYVTLDTVNRNGLGTLISPEVFSSGCLTFYYLISGYGKKSLLVYLKTQNAAELIWEVTREDGPSDNWEKAQIPIAPSKFRWRTQEQPKFNVEVVADVRQQNNQGDVGIDDIVFEANHNKAAACSFIPLSARPGARTTASEFSTLNCTFERSNFCGWFNTEDDSFNWSLNRGRTNTSFTGPAHDHTLGSTDAGFYAYVSGARRSNQRARLLSPEIVGHNTVCFQFWYLMYGGGMGSLRVMKRIITTGRETRLWEMAGDQGTSWHEGIVTIPANRQQPFQLVIEAEIGHTAQSDIAIDDLYTYTGRDCLRFFQQSNNPTGRPASANVVMPSPSFSPSTSPAARSGPLTKQKLACTFEAFTAPTCGWSQYYRDDFDWTLQQGSTPSTQTGPAWDHSTQQGHYIYIESSSPRFEGNSAYLMSSELDATVGCLKFYYHMKGSGIGTLRVLTRDSSSYKTVWELKGQQSEDWSLAQVPLYMPDGGQIFIEGVVGKTFQGDIALDDVDYEAGFCYTEPPSAGSSTEPPRTDGP